MFQPALHRENRIDVMHGLMRAHPFATLVSIQKGCAAVDHLPLVIHDELSGKGTIRGHIAKGNPLWLDRDETMDVVAVFQGPQAYVSPSWYPSKKQHGKAVPTWNYAVVHARGKLIFKEDSDWLLAHLAELTSRQESHRPVPWEVGDAPREYMARQVKGIVGLELDVASLEGKWKVSQNKDVEDRKGVKRGLRLESDQGAAAMAELINCPGTTA